jgi:hypothetical protein
MSNFKVGDWVRTKNGVFQIEDIDDHDFIEGVVEDVQLYFTDKNERWEWRSNAKLWQPRAGEWCWLVPIFKTTEVHKLVKYNKEEFDKDMKFEPFIGELPSFIKDNK